VASITLEVLKSLKMIALSTGFQETISHFSFAFRKDVWAKVKLLAWGAILCPGSNVLRSVELMCKKNFTKYHRVLNHDKWSAFSH